MLATMVAMFIAQPLGLVVQARVTTLPEVGGMFVRRINRRQWGRLVIHEVTLSQE